MLTDKSSRCTAPYNNLDSGHHTRRSQAHTELLAEKFELGILWNEYGVVGDIIVRKSTFCYTQMVYIFI